MVCSVKVKRRQYRPDENEDKHRSVETFKQISCLAWKVDMLVAHQYYLYYFDFKNKYRLSKSTFSRPHGEKYYSRH